MTKLETKAKHFIAIFKVGRNDLGYVTDPDSLEIIEIPKHQQQTALHGDEVEVKTYYKDKNITGEVIRVLSRTKHGFVGTLEFQNNLYFIQPDRDRNNLTITIKPSSETSKAVGLKVYAEITDWTNPKNKVYQGVVKKVLGKSGENDTEMVAFAIEKGFDDSFLPNTNRQAENIRKNFLITEDASNRLDLRNLNSFTIDPADAKDFDDALSIKTLSEDLYEIGIHIADASYFVRPNTDLDFEAKQRATSVYLVDRTIPMLPEALSNDLCSLNPNEDKYAFSVILTINKNAEVLKQWFGKTIINSKKRFTYEEAQEILNQKTGIFYHELEVLNTLAKKLAKERHSQGAISMEQSEVKFILNEQGHPIDVKTKDRQDTNKLIEEFMLLANKYVAKFMAEKTKKSVFVYRVHDKPDLDRVMNLKQFLEVLGYEKVPMKNGVIPASFLQNVIDKASNDDERNAISSAIVKSMAKAVYSTENIGHYGLAFQFYTHFTSPIRRYPDIMVHRLLNQILTNKVIPLKTIEEYKSLTEHCSKRERDAQFAEWDSIKYMQVLYIKDRLKKPTTGTIVNMNKNGFFVSETKSKADGFVRLSSLKDDYYTFNPDTYQTKGQKTNKVYKIGDTVNITPIKADIDLMQIDYEII